MNATGDTAPAPGPSPSRLGRRGAFALVGLWAVSAVLCLTQLAVGIAPLRALGWLSAGVGCGALAFAAACWVVRATRRGGAPWLAFPAAWLLGFGQFPLLALAAYPPLESTLAGAGRVEAEVVRSAEGEELHLRFPRAVRPAGEGNLRVGGEAVPRSFWSERAGAWEWQGKRTLVIDLPALHEAAGVEGFADLSVNSDRASLHFHYRDGKPVPHQQVVVRRR